MLGPLGLQPGGHLNREIPMDPKDVGQVGRASGQSIAQEHVELRQCAIEVATRREMPEDPRGCRANRSRQQAKYRAWKAVQSAGYAQCEGEGLPSQTRCQAGPMKRVAVSYGPNCKQTEEERGGCASRLGGSGCAFSGVVKFAL